MYGAILGDMIGAPYEFDMGDKTKDFPSFRQTLAIHRRFSNDYCCCSGVDGSERPR